MKKNKNLKLYFLGGPVQNISQTLGLNGNSSQRLGGITDVTEGILTGNPASIVSGGLNMAGASINSIKNTFKDKDSSVGDKILSASGIISPFAGIVSDQILGNKNKQKEEYKLSLNDRNAKFGNNSVFKDGGLIEYNNGGSHESNKFGGIPMGISPDGQMNTVEEGETRNEDYVFSDRRKLTAKDLDMVSLPKKFKGKTYAEVSKILNKEFEERPHDKISKDTKANMLKKLELISEATMPIEEQTEQFANGGYQLPTNLNTGLEMDKLQDFVNTTIPNRARDLIISGNSNFLDKLNFDASTLRYAPVIGGALDYLTTSPSEDIPLQKSTARYKPNYVSTEALDPKLAALRRKAISDIVGTSGGNLATARAGILGSNVGFTEGVSDAYRDIALSNISQDQVAQQFNANIDQFNIGQSNLEEQINAQNQAAYAQAKRQGLQNIFQNLGNIGQEQKLADIVTKAYGYTPTGNKKKCGGKLRFK